MDNSIAERLHILGRKNHGKTTLVVDLVEALTRRGLRVGTIKHTHHHHELDTPGKDSHRHQVAGSHRVGILSPTMNACFWPPDQEANGDARYDRFAPMMASCDLVLVEGDTQTQAAKIEVWRAAVGSAPLAKSDPTILAVVTDDAVDVDCQTLPRSTIAPLIEWILARRQR